jgi:hypothetical protein
MLGREEFPRMFSLRDDRLGTWLSQRSFFSFRIGSSLVLFCTKKLVRATNCLRTKFTEQE